MLFLFSCYIQYPWPGMTLSFKFEPCVYILCLIFTKSVLEMADKIQNGRIASIINFNIHNIWKPVPDS